MEYRFAPPAALAAAPVPLPVVLKPHVVLNETGGTIELALSARSRALERVSAELVLGAGVTGTSCTAGGGSSWAFDAARNVSADLGSSRIAGCLTKRRRFAGISLRSGTRLLSFAGRSRPRTLVSFLVRATSLNNLDRAYPRPARAVLITFEGGQHSFSGVKVDTLRVAGEAYKPYKGFRARSRGKIEWRW
jgi:AP-3 complex subunit mu